MEDPDYEQLKKRHLGEYHKYFNRMELSLNDTRENRLAEMMFHYARYLMIIKFERFRGCFYLR